MRKKLFAKITFEPRTHEEHVYHWHMCPHAEYPAEHRFHVHFLNSKEPYEGSVAELKALREMQRILIDERDPVRARYEARRARTNFERRAA